MDKSKYDKEMREKLLRVAEVADGVSDLEAAYMAGRLDAMLDSKRLQEVNNDHE